MNCVSDFKYKDRVELLENDETFICAYKGKKGYVVSVVGETAYLVLDCGHPYTIPMGKLRRVIQRKPVPRKISSL